MSDGLEADHGEVVLGRLLGWIGANRKETGHCEICATMKTAFFGKRVSVFLDSALFRLPELDPIRDHSGPPNLKVGKGGCAKRPFPAKQ